MTSPLFTDEHAERLKKRAGEKYRPSNGTEGEMFMSRWCAKCERAAAFREDRGDSCPIVDDVMAYDEDHESYPTEWQIGEDGQPKCTAFQLAEAIKQ